MPTKAEVMLAALAERQKGHEEKIKVELANFSEAIERAEKVAGEAKEIATQVASSVESMPARIIEAMDSRRKGARLEVKEWIMVALVLLSPFAASLANDIMHPAKQGTQQIPAK